MSKEAIKLEVSQDTYEQLKQIRAPQETFDTAIRRLLGLPKASRSMSAIEFPFSSMLPGKEIWWPFAEAGRNGERRKISEAVAYARRQTNGIYEAKADIGKNGIWIRRLR